MEHSLIVYGQNGLFALIVFAFIFIAKKLSDWKTPGMDEDREIEENSNLAVGIRRAGMYLGMAIALVGAVCGSGKGFTADIKALLIDGAVVTALMIIAGIINDRLILIGINNDQAVKNRNVAVGITEAGSFIATGLIMNGSLSGNGGGVMSTLVFFVLGQIALVACYHVYRAVTPYKIAIEIKNGNTSAGIAVLGVLCSLGMILKASIAGDFVSWKADLTSFGISFAAGIIFLMIFNFLVDLLFLPHTDLKTEIVRDKNNVALIITASLLFAVSVVISAVS
jgi:uncharacterized membrane protein YjfL (UPF0719 family)